MIHDLEIPKILQSGEIDFHIPGMGDSTELQLNDLRNLYTQLVCWCLVQRFWYYVLADPQVSDSTYDKVERFVKEIEASKRVPINRESPTRMIGGDVASDYPFSIIGLFRYHPRYQQKQKKRKRKR